ncbi:MAG TPA: transglycosylase SLT domain-containing protein [Streptosporangiaceae bacterium]|nr:transglycosylase SLT domain-containing protein [Streptosporangiaceae bacterium]
MSIPRTSRPSKSSRLALAGATASVAVLVSGSIVATSGDPAPGYRLTADAAAPTGPAGGGRATVHSRTAEATRHAAGHRAPVARWSTAGSLELAAGAKLAGGGRPARRGRPGHRAAAAQHDRRRHEAAHRPGRLRLCSDSTLHWWICHAEHVLQQHGTPRSRLSTSAAYIVVRHESGGNPHAYNGWDSNAAAGHPSEGIAQIIGPTFHAYALHGYTDIWNPVDNMIAAFRYAISRYGSMNSIPGVVAVRQGGSYVGY